MPHCRFLHIEKTFNGVSASLGFTYQLTKHISLKANVGRGYRAPNITEMASNGLDPGAHIIYLGNRNFNPEFSFQEDIGASARFTGASADVSMFNNNIQNYIYLTLLADANGNPITDAQGNKTYQYQQASAQLYGMELWYSIHPEKWKGFHFDNSMAMVYGYNRKATFKDKRTNGAYLPLIPPLKILSSIAQKIELPSGIFSILTPKIEMEFSAAQNRYLGLNATETRTPGYTLFNAGIMAERKFLKDKTLQLQLQVNNVLNAAYQSNLSRLKYFEYYNQSPTGHYGIYSMGRNVCMKMILPF